MVRGFQHHKKSIIPLYLSWKHDSNKGTYTAEGKEGVWRIKKILSKFFLQKKSNGIPNFGDQAWSPLQMYSRLKDAKIEAESLERSLIKEYKNTQLGT